MRPDRDWINETTIANGASVSEVMGLNNQTLVGVFVPSPWTAADITFQVAYSDANGDATGWSDVRDAEGTELTLTGFSAGDYVALPAGALNGVEFLRFRSGTSGTPVNQGAARTLRYAIRLFA